MDEDRPHAQLERRLDVVLLAVADDNAFLGADARPSHRHPNHRGLWLQASGVDRGNDAVYVLGNAQQAKVLPVAVSVAPVRVAGDDVAYATAADLGAERDGPRQRLHPVGDGDRQGAPDAPDGVCVRRQTATAEARANEQLGRRVDRDLVLGRDGARLVARPAALDQVIGQRLDRHRLDPGHRGSNPDPTANGIFLADRPGIRPQRAAHVDQCDLQPPHSLGILAGRVHGRGLVGLSGRATAAVSPMIASMLRFLTSGESHGPQLTVVIEGLPAGLEISEEDLRRDLARRQGGHGRGGRQKIETDVARIVSGVRGGFTIGSPVTLVLENKDHVNWTGQMTASKEGFEPKVVTRLRPGHAGPAGVLHDRPTDIRNLLERSSARETATTVAAGGVARKLLGHFGIDVLSYTQSIGTIDIGFEGIDPDILDPEDIEASPVRCPDPDASKRMVAAIDEVAEQGDTLGGTFRIVARGVPPGLGSYVHWDRKLDGRLAQAVMFIHAIQGVEFGAGLEGAARRGSDFHDEIDYQEGRFRHLTNRAGGLTGGVPNGEPIDLPIAVKPISTVKKPMAAIDLKTKAKTQAPYEGSDACVVPAA